MLRGALAIVALVRRVGRESTIVTSYGTPENALPMDWGRNLAPPIDPTPRVIGPTVVR